MVHPLSEVFKVPVIPLIHRSNFVRVRVWFVETSEQFWVNVVRVNILVVMAKFAWVRINNSNLGDVSSWDVLYPSTLLL